MNGEYGKRPGVSTSRPDSKESRSTRGHRRVVLGTLLALVAFASSAGADCAWVLWEELATMNFQRSGSDTSEWRIVQATTDSRDCKTLVDMAVVSRSQALRGPQGEPAKGLKVEGNRVSLMSPGVALIYTYACLPDSVDPRGPKGGGR